METPLNHGGALCYLCREPTWFDACGCGTSDEARVVALGKKILVQLIKIRVDMRMRVEALEKAL